jgi:hypothetical protein
MPTVNTSTVGSAGRNYATLTLWEAAKNGDLVAADTIEQAACYNDSVLNESFMMNGWVVDATRYPRVYTPTAERHTGTAGTGFTINYTGINGYTIKNFTNYCRIEGIAFDSTDVDASHYSIWWENSGAASEVLIAYNLFYGDRVDTCHGIWIDHADANVRLYNNFIYNHNGAGVNIEDCHTAYIYNNTVYLNSYGIRVNGANTGTVIAKNNAVFDSDNNDFDGTFSSESDCNCSSDATAPGLHSLHSKSVNNNLVSIVGGSEDLHCLDTSSDIYAAGADLTADPYLAFFDDIDGDARSFWCMGGDEFTQSVSSSQALKTAKRAYSIYKNGLVLLEFECELVDLMSDIGDTCTIETGNPQIPFTKALIWRIERQFGDTNRVKVSALTGGWQWDEENVW